MRMKEDGETIDHGGMSDVTCHPTQGKSKTGSTRLPAFTLRDGLPLASSSRVV